MTVLGRVEQLWVFPVKSMSGAMVDEAEIGTGGLAGDREWAVVDSAGRPVSLKQEPRLREAVARLVGDQVRVDVPGAAPGLDEAAAAAALSDWLGREVRLQHRPGTGFVDVAPVHLVSTSSMADAAHAEECDACDVTAPRANLVLALEPDAGNEREWVGRTLVAGGSELVLERLPKHCLGVYAEVARPGRLAVGDVVRAETKENRSATGR